MTTSPRAVVSASAVRFVYPIGLALGALRRYVFSPAAAGTLTKGAQRKAQDLTAARATTFAIRQLKVALPAAASISRLRSLSPQLARFEGELSAIAVALRLGRVSTRRVSLAEAQGFAISAAAAARGYPVKLILIPLF